MDAIIVSIITGIFSLVAIWYQNHLQISNEQKNNPQSQSATLRKVDISKSKFNIWRLLLTLFLIVAPFGFSSYVQHMNYRQFFDYMLYYYLIWAAIVLAAILINWKNKTLAEKIILIVADAFLVYAAFFG